MITFSSDTNFTDTLNPTDKGYPAIVEPVTYFVGSIYPNIVGYTSFADMGDFYFVGNTYVAPEYRGQGHYSQLLSDRNNHLYDKPKIALVNPMNDTDINILREQVAKQGGEAVYCYTQVSDIMSEGVYADLAELPMYIYR